ncbi:MAG: epoxyqueuosine reductase QueH [Parcubacteria group bacterium]
MRVLLHVCCAVCGGYVIEQLKNEGHEVAIYFYNPNIFPVEEYERRLAEVRGYCNELGVEFIPCAYQHDDWLAAVNGYEKEPEGGKRCAICFDYRLDNAMKMAVKLKCDAVATTLTMGTQKPVDVINKIGTRLASENGLTFIDVVWRKNEGVKKANMIAGEKGFYRQNYCGCEFSINTNTALSE